MSYLDDLLNELEDSGAWPPRSETEAWKKARQWRAFLENDRDQLRQLMQWPTDRQLKVDPLAGLIAAAWADHLWSENPTITASKPEDQELLDDLLGDDFTAELHAAEVTRVGEGEVWWRVYVDPEVADVPLLEWHSREVVIPSYVGKRLVAVLLVTELQARLVRERKTVVWRHLEGHEDGRVVNVLYRGTATRLGARRDLDDHPETAGLAEEWSPGPGMMMGRLANGSGRRAHDGRSDFDGIQDFLTDLNEAVTIGAENVRNTAKSRMVLPEEAVTSQRNLTGDLVDLGDGSFIAARGQWDAGSDVVVVPTLDGQLGGTGTGPFQVLQYQYDPQALVTHKRDLVETALTRIGLTPQWVGIAGDGAEGYAITGTATRLRMIPTTRAGKGKNRAWRDQLPLILRRMATVDALGKDAGGLGRDWADPTTPPSLETADPLPEDPVETAQVEVSLVQGGVRSRFLSVQSQHPDWTPEQVQEEVDRIRGDQAAASSALGGFGGAPA